MKNDFANAPGDFTAPIRIQALRAFGEDEAERWLNTGWRVFNNRTPLEMARGKADASRVMDYISNLTGAEEMLTRAAPRIRASRSL